MEIVVTFGAIGRAGAATAHVDSKSRTEPLKLRSIPLHADVRAKHADERWKSCIHDVMIGGSKPLHQNFQVTL